MFTIRRCSTPRPGICLIGHGIRFWVGCCINRRRFGCSGAPQYEAGFIRHGHLDDTVVAMEDTG